MKALRRFRPGMALVLLGLASPLASAVPYTFSFNGTVSGAQFQEPTILGEFPLGTAASFTVSFDAPYDLATATATTAISSGFDFGAATGSVSLGGRTWTLDSAGLFSLTYDPTTDQALVYNLQFGGTGPTLGPLGASLPGEFFSLFLPLSPSLQLQGGQGPTVGFGYTTNFDGGGSATIYGYAVLSGEFTVGAQTVPEPGTLGLLGLSLLALVMRPARRRKAATA